MGAQRRMLSANAIDSSPIIALIEIQMLLDALWQGPRMLDHFAMHVQDIQIAIGALANWTGRNQCSEDRMNSVSDSSSGRKAEKIGPS